MVALRIDAIKKRMEELSLDQNDLAEKAGIASSTITRWFHGANSPTLDKLGGLSGALGMDLAEIIAVDGVPLSTLTRNKLIGLLASEQDTTQVEPTAPVTWASRLGPGEDAPSPTRSGQPGKQAKRRRR